MHAHEACGSSPRKVHEGWQGVPRVRSCQDADWAARAPESENKSHGSYEGSFDWSALWVIDVAHIRQVEAVFADGQARLALRAARRQGLDVPTPDNPVGVSSRNSPAGSGLALRFWESAQLRAHLAV